MTYRDILVVIDGSPDTTARTDLAVALARQYDAHIIGMDVTTASAFEGRWREQAERVQRAFEESLVRSAVKGEYRTPSGTHGGAERFGARYADLVIAPQGGSAPAELLPSEVPDSILISCGVPMLIVPAGWQLQPVGESVVIGWNASREATRAVRDALPILQRAQSVTLISYAEGPLGKDSAEQMREHLSRHDVKVETSIWPEVAQMGPVDALFASLDRTNADLIVAGAYGHSRWMEGLFGGATEELLREPVLPVLMSH